MNPAIAVENLTRTYGSLTAVDSVSFEVRPGETIFEDEIFIRNITKTTSWKNEGWNYVRDHYRRN